MAIKIINTNTIAIRLGFENEQHMNMMISYTDISTNEKRKAFDDWVNNDATRDGLELLASDNVYDLKLGDTVAWQLQLDQQETKFSNVVDEFINSLESRD